jgi:hypothetical protein
MHYYIPHYSFLRPRISYFCTYRLIIFPPQDDRQTNVLKNFLRFFVLRRILKKKKKKKTSLESLPFLRIFLIEIFAFCSSRLKEKQHTQTHTHTFYTSFLITFRIIFLYPPLNFIHTPIRLIHIYIYLIIYWLIHSLFISSLPRMF